MPEIAVLIPVLARPHRVEPLLASLHESQGEARLRPFFLASPEDEAELESLRASDADFAVVTWPAGRGDYARKMNIGIGLSDEPWIFLGADDLAFAPGWADEALLVAAHRRARVVGTNDLGNLRVRSGHTATHSLVARSYVEEHGGIDEPTILHQAYSHNWVDAELVEVAKARGEFAFARGSVVEHLHPHWKKAEMDATYAKGLASYAEDAALYRSRVPLWTAK